MSRRAVIRNPEMINLYKKYKRAIYPENLELVVLVQKSVYRM